MDASSNIPIGSYPDWVKIPLASKLVLVPIKVQVPPKIDAYESGINNFDEAIFMLLAKVKITGMSTITTGVLFIKAEAAATPNTITKRNRL